MSEQAAGPREITGAQSLVRSLEAVGVEVVFGIPGGAILPAYDPLFDSTASGTSWSATSRAPGTPPQGYAAATGRVGVCMATCGPGRDQPGHPARRRLHGLGADRGDHRPGRRRRPSAPTPSRRPTSAASRCRSPSTTSWSPTPPTSRGRSPRRSTSPPPAGPARCWSTSPRTPCRPRPRSPGRAQLDLPGYRPVTRPHGKQVREAARLIARGAAAGAVRRRRGASRPARAEELRRARRADRHPRRHHADGPRRVPRQPPAAPGHARHARHRRRGRPRCRRRDLLVSLGARFDDRVTGKLSTFAPHAKVIHADIDPAEIGKNRVADVPIVGDCREVIAELVAALQAEHRRPGSARRLRGLVDAARRTGGQTLPARLRRARRRLALAAVRHRAARARSPGRTRSTSRGRPAPDVGRAVHRLRAPRHLAQLRRPRHDGLRGAGRDGRQGRPAGHAPSGRSTATAASR